MSYSIEIRLAAKSGWHTPSEARRYYGRYARNGVTVHWWNSPNKVKDSDHDNICNYILGKSSRGEGSVNYVVSNRKLTMLVNPDNVAWASQAGNPTTVSIEFSPHLSAEGYKKAGWLINELFNPRNGRYKKSARAWKHSDWIQTICPGTLNPSRMLNEARKWYNGDYNPKPAPPPKPIPVPPSKPLNGEFTLWKDGGTYVTNKQPTNLYDLTNTKDWGSVKIEKTFKKDEKIEIVGSFRNFALNREYYITKYSFDKKNATGFHPADLDIYAPPAPKPPVPPEDKPHPPVEPTDPPVPAEPTQEEKVNFIYKAIKAILSKLGINL